LATFVNRSYFQNDSGRGGVNKIAAISPLYILFFLIFIFSSLKCDGTVSKLSTKPNRKATQSHTHPLLCLPYYSIHYVNLSEALSLCAENVALNLSLFSQLYAILGYAFPEIAPGPQAEPFVFSLIGNACRA
jgi:hypothetical protein